MFVDTSGIYCLYNRDQNDHKAAIEFYYSAPRRIITNYVLAEYVALADKRGSSRKDAIDFSERTLDDDEIELIWVDEDLHRQAIQLLLEREDKNLLTLRCRQLPCNAELWNFGSINHRHTF